MKRLPLVAIILLFSTFIHGQHKFNVADILQRNKVVVYDSSKTEPGINLVNLGAADCFLLSMTGKVEDLHMPFVNILTDGNFIGCTDSELVKFDADMDIIWRVPAMEVHHEITSDENGNIYLLSSDFHEFVGVTVRFDVLKIYSPDGQLIYKWCTFDHLEEFTKLISKSAWLKDLAVPYSHCKNATEYILQYPLWFLSPYGVKDYDRKAFPVFEFSHFNSIQVLPENDVAKKIPAFKKGNLLLSFNPYSSYGILNLATGKIEWVGYLPERTTLHSPVLTSTGGILIFQNSTDEPSNGGCNVYSIPVQTSHQYPIPQPRLWTSITEYDPLTGVKIWEYTAGDKNPLRADLFGSAQRLPNGNTLICSTTIMNGRIFEVTANKEIVWDYISPGNGLYRAKRIKWRNMENH